MACASYASGGGGEKAVKARVVVDGRQRRRTQHKSTATQAQMPMLMSIRSARGSLSVQARRPIRTSREFAREISACSVCASAGCP